VVLNLVGLKRRGFTLEQRKHLSHAFRLLYRSGMAFKEALIAIENEVEQTQEVVQFLTFCKTTTRGLIGLESEVEETKELQTAAV